MANTVIYVSHSGSNTVPYDTWAKAATTLAAAITQSGTTGTDFYVDSTQAETGVSTFTFKGAAATPDRMFSVTTAGSTPPVTADLTAGASFSSSTTTAIQLNGFVYIYGCTFTAGSGSNAATMGLGISAAAFDVTLDTCKLICGGTLTGSRVQIGNTTALIAQRATLINTTMKFSHAGQGIDMFVGTFRWLNTASAIDGTGTLPTTLFLAATSQRGSNIICDSVDLSALTNKALAGAWQTSGCLQFINCGLNSGYTVSTPTGPGACPTDLIISDGTATTYNQARYSYQGTLTPSTSIHNNATDGTTGISWQVITTANATPQSPFECFPIVQWAASGTYTATKIFMTSATGSLKTNDVWVDVEYLGSGYPLGKPATSFGAGSGTATLPQIPQGTTPGSIDTASASWATSGQGTNYDLQVPSFTTSAAGYVRFTVKVGKPSLTIYIDPAVTIA